MSAPAAFQATFANLRPVNGRKVMQLIFEVPIEQANAALRVLGGVPNPAEAVWCAVARIDPKASEKPASEAPKRKWEDLPPAQQCAIRCGEDKFIHWFRSEYPTWVHLAEGDVISAVRKLLGVRSRADINSDAQAAKRWRELDGLYNGFQRGAR